MRVDKGAVMVVYRVNERNKREFLVLKRDKNWTGWELPKGHLEHDDHMATVLVELDEETGIRPKDVIRIESSGEDLTFEYTQGGRKVISDFRCFTVEVPREVDIDLSSNPSEEHSDYRWLDRKKAVELLKHEEQKNLLT